MASTDAQTDPPAAAKPGERVQSSDDTSSMGFEKVRLEDVSLSSGRSSPAATDDAAAPQQAPERPEEIAAAPQTPATAAAATRSPAARGPAHGDPLRELEVAAAEAVAHTKEAAQQATQQLMKGAAEAKKELTSFVSSLWSAFDAPGTQAKQQQSSDEELRVRLGLGEGVAVLESFRCKLIQTYEPVGNDFTPRKNIAFSGQLHIATACVCFEFDGAGASGAKPIKLAAADIKSFKREGDAVELQLAAAAPGQTGGAGPASVVVGGFALPRLEVDSVLALLEHLTSESQ